MTHSSPPTETRELAHALNTFGFELYQRLPTDGNCFFSPFSVSMAVGSLLAGARGRTRDELVRVLGIADLSGSLPQRFATLLNALRQRRGWEQEWDRTQRGMRRVERDVFLLRVASGLFVQSGYPLRPPYGELLRSAFQADLTSLDFGRPEEAALRINSWVSDRTNERINQIVWRESLTPMTRLVLANAVYFCAGWANPFSKDQTRREPFYLTEAPETSCEVPMMHLTVSLRHMVDEKRGVQAVCLPYRAMSMVVVLPDRGRFNDVHRALDSELLEHVVTRARSRRIALRLPRFQVETGYSLGEVVQQLGIHAAVDASQADFGEITEQPTGLAVSELLHRARIRVDEFGTEAAAATAVVTMPTSAMPRPEEPPFPFVVDRPFFFVIRDDETNAILFVGRVTDPLE